MQKIYLHTDGAQFEYIELIVRIALGRLDIEEYAASNDGADCGPSYGWVVVPVEHFAISKHVGNAGQCDAEDGGIAELLEVDGETAGGIFMIRHSNEGDEDAK